jgi:hypothetical protein
MSQRRSAASRNQSLKTLERVLKISRPVLRRGGAAGFVARRLQISREYAPSSRLAIRSAALALPFPIFFQNTLLNSREERREKTFSFYFTLRPPRFLRDTSQRENSAKTAKLFGMARQMDPVSISNLGISSMRWPWRNIRLPSRQNMPLCFGGSF